MYTPPLFKIDDLADMHGIIRANPFAQFVTATPGGLIATPLPMMISPEEGEFGTLYAHLARANAQWTQTVQGEALVLFQGHDTYVTPNWYATKAETHKVVPTWNYEAVHAYGTPEFFEDADRLLDVVSRLPRQHETPRPAPWAVSDAPAEFVRAQLKGIVGVRIPLSRIEGKRKMSQNRNAADRAGVAEGLAAEGKTALAALIPR